MSDYDEIELQRTLERLVSVIRNGLEQIGERMAEARESQDCNIDRLCKTVEEALDKWDKARVSYITEPASETDQGWGRKSTDGL